MCSTIKLVIKFSAHFDSADDFNEPTWNEFLLIIRNNRNGNENEIVHFKLPV